MIKSELGQVTLTSPLSTEELNRSLIYADFSSIMDAITHKYGISTTIKFLESYCEELGVMQKYGVDTMADLLKTYEELKENKENDSRNKL